MKINKSKEDLSTSPKKPGNKIKRKEREERKGKYVFFNCPITTEPVPHVIILNPAREDLGR